MNYKEIVGSCKKALKKAGLLKTAQDLAELLDHPLLAYPTGDKIDNWEVRRTATMREGVFNFLCSTFANASIRLPDLEPQFYESLLVSEAEKGDLEEADRVRAHVTSQITGAAQGDVPVAQALMLITKAVPQCFKSYGSLDRKTITAKLNQILVAIGREPIRPDWSKIPVPGAREQAKAKRPIRIAIVDDEAESIVKTFVALAGWPGVNIIPIHYVRDTSNKPAKEALMLQLAERVFAEDPHIVLMDEGLINFEGSELIPFMCKLIEKPPLFVANTGGLDNKLREVGAFPNCDKGKRIGPVAQAISHLELE